MRVRSRVHTYRWVRETWGRMIGLFFWFTTDFFQDDRIFAVRLMEWTSGLSNSIYMPLQRSWV
jgi:hypothetical protein